MDRLFFTENLKHKNNNFNTQFLNAKAQVLVAGKTSLLNHVSLQNMCDVVV